MWTLRVLMRVSAIAVTLLCVLVSFLVHSVAARLRGTHRGLIELGERLASTFETLGGGFVKIGQILSMRTDILSDALAIPLRRLQDSQVSFPADDARAIIEHSLGLPIETVFRSFDNCPIGSASIAQVHRAVLRNTGAEVAVKVRRPGIKRTITTDSRVLLALARILSWLPPFRGIPLVEAIQQVAVTVEAQASFRLEADRHRQFSALFESGAPVRIPTLLDQYCSDEVLVMEYIPQLVRITDPELDEELHRNAVIAGLHGLYQMLFVGGLIHCDLHPGNILVGRDGSVVILDFGFSTAMPPPERAAFAEFFLSLALGDGSTAARIMLETALRVPDDLDSAGFEREISDLVIQSAGLSAAGFLIASFVSSLFRIQRKYSVYGSSSFTMAILSLTVYEGIIRHRCADLEFQREAVPTLLLSLHKTV